MRETRRVVIPWGLIGLLAMILGIETFVHSHRDQLAGNYDFGWRLAARGITRAEARQSPILCFGDSLLGTGIAPQVLTHRLGLRAYNFAMPGSVPSVSYYMLQRALDAGARPRAILVDYKWSSLESKTRDCEHILPIVAGPREFLELAWSTRDVSFFAVLMTRKYLPSYRCRFEIRSDVDRMLEGKAPLDRREMLPIAMRQSLVNRGAGMAAFHPSQPFQGEVNLNAVWLFPPRWTPNPLKTAYIERFFALAARHDIPVFWLLPPNCPKVFARRQEIGAEAAYTAYVARIQGRHPNVTVVDGRSDSYPAWAFVDTTHLNCEGAKIFSDDVAQVVAQTLARRERSERWVALPAFRHRALDVDVEDIGRTLKIVKEAGLLRR
jgi:hypothetical protein